MDPWTRWLAGQHGQFAVWQLREAGFTRAQIRTRTERHRRVFDGVHGTGHAPLTDEQWWWAATLTHPRTALSDESAAARHGFWDRRRPFETVTRQGSGGPERHGRLMVRRSLRMDDVVMIDGLPTMNAARTVLDLVARQRSLDAAKRVVRDALRTKAVTPAGLRTVLARHAGRRGVARLRAITDEYADLPIHLTRSDAEALVLAVLAEAAVPPPRVNVRIAGEEADFSWWDVRRIIELDGPQWHGFRTEDERKTRAWEAAGWTVHRLPTDDVYAFPGRLLALAPPTRLERWWL